MNDLDIFILYRKGYSIEEIARKYKKITKLKYKENISLNTAKRIVELTILSLSKTILNDLLN